MATPDAAWEYMSDDSGLMKARYPHIQWYMDPDQLFDRGVDNAAAQLVRGGATDAEIQEICKRLFAPDIADEHIVTAITRGRVTHPSPEPVASTPLCVGERISAIDAPAGGVTIEITAVGETI